MKLCMGCMHEMDDEEVICPNCGYREGTLPSESYYLVAGTVLAQRYIVGKVLGYGGFGITYIGWDSQLNRVVAIKEYFPSEFATRGERSKEITAYSGEINEQYLAGLEKFIAEAKRLAQFCETDGIVHIYDCIRENGTGYIIMEYLEGETVEDFLKEKKKYTYEEAEKIILNVLDALEKVHKIGLIHRDVAPDNIFIRNDGHVCLLDFGAARNAVSELTKGLSVILKPGYAPVEQYQSKGEQGTWTDVYGTGATFYRMITGVRPDESIERLIKDEIVRPSELGVSIDPIKEQALMKSISVKKENRFQTATEFKDALLEKNVEKDDKKKALVLKKKIVIAGIIAVCVVGTVAFTAIKQLNTNMPNSNSVLKMSVLTEISKSAETSMSTLTDTPVPQNEQEKTGETEAVEYKFNIAVNGKETELTIANKTKYSFDILQIISVHDTEEILAEKTKQNCDSPDILNVNENEKYMIRLMDSQTGKTLTYYNVGLSQISNLILYEWDDYTYVEYTMEGQNDPVDTKHYRTFTYEEPLKLYALTNLSIRDLPSTEIGTKKSKYVSGDEIQVYGTSVGLKGAEEINWYLVKNNTGYGYISAETGYTTDNKADVEAKVEIEQKKQTTTQNATSQSMDTGSTYNSFSEDEDNTEEPWTLEDEPENPSPTTETPSPDNPVDPSPGDPVDPLPGDPVDPSPGDPVDPSPGDPVDPLPGDPVDTPSVDEPEDPVEAETMYEIDDY